MDRQQRIYRKLGLSDLDAVLGMNDTFREGFIVRENARQFLTDPKNWIFACLEQKISPAGENKLTSFCSEDKIVGFACGYELARLDGAGNMLYLHEVGVAEAYWRQGIATRILEGVRTLCALSGICRFFLFTHPDNHKACALYEKCGGEIGRDSGNGDRVYFFQTKQ
ncbi:MAG: GNAT family N-acetyltransferase [Oscillospiraceae bacterium]